MAEIKIRSLTGRVVAIQIELSSRVGDLKEAVEIREGIPPSQQKFLLQGRQLDDDRILSDCGIVDGSELHLVLSLRGGC